MALVNSGNVSNGFFGHRTTQNMLHRSGEYYLFYVDYNGAYWNNVLKYKKASSVDDLLNVTGVALLPSYGSLSQDLYAFGCSAYVPCYDESNDTMLFIASTYYNTGAYNSNLVARTGAFDVNGNISASSTHTINTSPTSADPYGYPNVLNLNSGKWVIVNCEDIYNVNPMSYSCNKINVYISDDNVPSDAPAWTSGNLIIDPSGLNKIPCATAVSRVDNSTDDFIVLYHTFSGNYVYPRSKRWNSSSGVFEPEVTLELPFYDVSTIENQLYYTSNIVQDSSGVPHFMKMGVNYYKTSTSTANSGVYTAIYNKDTDSWSVTRETLSNPSGAYPYSPFAPSIEFINDIMFVVFGQNRTISSIVEFNLAARFHEGWFYLNNYLSNDITAEDLWIGDTPQCCIEYYDGKALVGLGWRNRFGNPDHCSIYMHSLDEEAFTIPSNPGTKYAVGLAQDFENVPYLTALTFDDRYDYLKTTWSHLKDIDNPLPDNAYQLVLVGNVTETGIWGSYASWFGNLDTNQETTVEITSLSRDYVLTGAATNDVVWVGNGAGRSNNIHYSINGFITDKIQLTMFNHSTSLVFNSHYLYNMLIRNGAVQLVVNEGKTLKCYNCILSDSTINKALMIQVSDVANNDPNLPEVDVSFLTIINSDGEGIRPGYWAPPGYVTGSVYYTGWQNVTLENICVVDSDNSDWASQLFNANGVWRNNADSDGTLISGVNHVHNVVSSNEFISTTYGVSGYLQIDTDNSVLGRAGVSPSQTVTLDFSGEARPGQDGYYSIGAYEMAFTPTELAELLYSNDELVPILLNTRITPYKSQSSDQIRLKLKLILKDRLLYSQVPYNIYSNYNGSWELINSGTTNKYGIDNVIMPCSGISSINNCQFLINATYNNEIYSSNVLRVNFR